METSPPRAEFTAPFIKQIDIDLLLCPEWIIPIEPAGLTLKDHALAVSQGRIIDLLPADIARQRFRPRETLALPGQVLLPGLVNLHSHAAMNLLRGYADDQPLMRWLTEHIWPAEQRHLAPDFVHAGTLLACAEMLRGGITTFNDMYFFPAAAARAVSAAGMRAMLGMVILEFPTRYASDAEDYINKALAFRDEIGCLSDNAIEEQTDPRIGFCLAPHAPYTVADNTLSTVAMLSAQLDLPIHMHIHETRQEIEDSLKLHGVRPLQRLHRLGLLGPQLIAVHAVHLEPAEIELLAREACHIAHCPTSNLKLGSGIAPLAAMVEQGINFGLGTDGAASNNRLDLLQEMRHAALLAKGSTENASTLNAHAMLQAATLGGARALGLDSRIGSLLPGKAADLCTIRLDQWTQQPCFDPASHIIYVAGREDVQHVWVAGQQVLQNGTPTRIEIPELIRQTGLWHTKLAS